jgi:hypothetical protein
MPDYYTGIGSRKTPLPHLAEIRTIAEDLASRGYTLRSGGAAGADSAFEQGCGNGGKEIYLSWKGFNKNRSKLWFSKFPYEVCQEAYRLARLVHPVWDRLAAPIKTLHARNVMQVLGKDLQTPSEFVVCWTPDGACVGGTATAIKLAQQHNILVINLALEDFLI